MLPGDLILISPLAPTFSQRAIQRTQEQGGYHPEDSRWTHASVYLGSDFDICEATVWKGVHRASLLDSVASHQVRVRRLGGLDSGTRWKIALAAALEIGRRYGLLSALKIALRARAGLHQPQETKTQSAAAVICSELFADSVLAATGQTLQWNHTGKEVSPAFLSFVPELTDVPLEWRKIPSRPNLC